MIRFEKVTKTFETGAGEIQALSEIDLNIEKGCIFGIIGSSGAGKSTLVRCMNLLERPTSGNVFFDDINLTRLPASQLRQMRRRIGMIFQQFNLLEQRDALGNVCYPLEISGVPKKEAREKAKKLLTMVGLEDRIHSYPIQLSGGQKQRVAIARALATDPDVLLCDEATSALDPGTTRAILDLLKNINENLGVTIVVITHEMKVVEQICDKVAVISDGKLVETGDVKDIFLKPQSKVTQHLLFPQKDEFTTADNQRVFRLSFDGQSSNEPVIANLVLECQAKINILGASTEDVGGKAYGQMLIAIPEDEMKIARVKHYLDEIGVPVEEIVEREVK
ncbi:MAG: methionine ABC transporter ATP-binding protein [Agathobacter sp.]